MTLNCTDYYVKVVVLSLVLLLGIGHASAMCGWVVCFCISGACGNNATGYVSTPF